MELGIQENEWYEEATRSKVRWRELCDIGLEDRVKARTQATVRTTIVKEVECSVCTKKFSRESDRKRQKCLEESQKPLYEQRGAAQYNTCRKWFGRHGGLVVHTCRPSDRTAQVCVGVCVG